MGMREKDTLTAASLLLLPLQLLLLFMTPALFSALSFMRRDETPLGVGLWADTIGPNDGIVVIVSVFAAAAVVTVRIGAAGESTHVLAMWIALLLRCIPTR